MNDKKTTSLVYDPARLDQFSTRLVVQATRKVGKGTATYQEAVDIGALEEASLFTWLREGGGDNPRAENVVGVILGHGRLHPLPDDQNNRFTWNRQGPNRKAIEAFLREMEAKAKREADTLLFKRHDARVLIEWLRQMLDKTPAQLLKE